MWSAPGPMTDLGPHADWFGALPEDPAALRALVSGLLLHPEWAVAYDVTVDERGEEEKQLRKVADVVTALRARSEAPPGAERAPAERTVGVCRTFTVLHVALLRHQGHTARARCGVAAYFDGKWIDHWVTERWDGERWVREDAQLDDLQRQFVASVDPDDVDAAAFLTAGECWQAIRAGDIDADTCGIFDFWGTEFVRHNLYLDLAALNGVELLPWDDWYLPQDDETADEVAAACVRADPDELRAIYARHPVTPTVTSYRPTGNVEIALDL